MDGYRVDTDRVEKLTKGKCCLPHHDTYKVMDRAIRLRVKGPRSSIRYAAALPWEWNFL
jgi:hypothetical protein